MDYKIIDGVVYKVVDTTEIKQKMKEAEQNIKPYVDGKREAQRCIDAYKDQIAGYDLEISKTIAASGIDPAVARLVDENCARSLGFLPLI